MKPLDLLAYLPNFWAIILIFMPPTAHNSKLFRTFAIKYRQIVVNDACTKQDSLSAGYRYDFRWLNISVGYYSKRSETCRWKEQYSNNGNAYWYSGRFPVFCIRFPASTLNVGQRKRPRFMSVLVGTFVYWLDAL